MSTKILREYLRESINEEFFRRDLQDEEGRKRTPSFLSKLKSFFFGSDGNDVVDEWIDSKEDYYDISFDDEFRDEVKEFSKKAYRKALARTRGKKEKAEKILRRTLDVRYAKKLRQIEAAYLRDFEDDEDEEDKRSRR